jgi:hypothetical protein
VVSSIADELGGSGKSEYGSGQADASYSLVNWIDGIRVSVVPGEFLRTSGGGRAGQIGLQQRARRPAKVGGCEREA